METLVHGAGQVTFGSIKYIHTFFFAREICIYFYRKFSINSIFFIAALLIKVGFFDKKITLSVMILTSLYYLLLIKTVTYDLTLILVKIVVT